MTEREARIAFNMIPTVGAVTFARLVRETEGDAAAAWEFYPNKLDWEGKPPDWEREMERAEKMGVKIVTEADAEYPQQLRNIPSPPLALYVAGSVEALSKSAVALVGTRHSTEYGRDVAERFAFGLAKRGWCVVSGLARGIDACAHRGALAAEGVTVGVLGGALDMFYPNENRALAREMVEKGGCVASEFPFGRAPDVQTFPQRNRIVSGLAKGVVAVECPLHSGTLITCTRAVEQGRAVMAVPGRIDWRTSEGCHHLIREGARMVTSVDDIVEELTPLSARAKAAASAAARNAEAQRRGEKQTAPEEKVEPLVGCGPAKASRCAPALPESKISSEEASVLRAVPEEGATMDAVARACGLGAACVSALLVGLRLKGRVRLLPGNRVAPARPH
jgi:DNA processing protein